MRIPQETRGAPWVLSLNDDTGETKPQVTTGLLDFYCNLLLHQHEICYQNKIGKFGRPWRKWNLRKIKRRPATLFLLHCHSFSHTWLIPAAHTFSRRFVRRAKDSISFSVLPLHLLLRFTSGFILKVICVTVIFV